MAAPSSLADTIRLRARELGFDAVGFAAADVPLERDHEAYLRFVDQGMHAEMNYLAAHAEVRRRLDGEGILQGAKTVICLARSYAGQAPSAEGVDEGIAAYGRGRDYHGFLRKRLQKLAAFVRGLAPNANARAMSDTAPVLERAWAARAGLGFVGKNGLLIVPGTGSYCLLGEVVTTLRIDAPAVAMSERCGSCRLCLDHCPTEAFVAPFVLDPRRCISYWTIESRALAPPELEEAQAEKLFGCDDCQDVCPYNQRTRAVDNSPFASHARWSQTSLAELVSLDEAGFRRLTEGSPLRRATRFGLARNALLRAWKKRDKAALNLGLKAEDARLRELSSRLLEQLLTKDT